MELKYDFDFYLYFFVVSCGFFVNIFGYWLIFVRRVVKFFEQFFSGVEILKFLCNGVYYYLLYDEIVCLLVRELFNVIYRLNELKRVRGEEY